MLCTFSFGCFQIYQNKSAKIIAINFIRTIVPIKYMRKISAVGLFCLYKFENNQTRTCTTFFRMSKLTEPYFSEKVLLKNVSCYVDKSLHKVLQKRATGDLKFFHGGNHVQNQSKTKIESKNRIHGTRNKIDLSPSFSTTKSVLY